METETLASFRSSLSTDIVFRLEVERKNGGQILRRDNGDDDRGEGEEEDAESVEQDGAVHIW